MDEMYGVGPCMCGGCRRCLHDQGVNCGDIYCKTCSNREEDKVSDTRAVSNALINLRDGLEDLRLVLVQHQLDMENGDWQMVLRDILGGEFNLKVRGVRELALELDDAICVEDEEEES